MADFLTRRMFQSYLGICQCVIIAAYTLLQAKEHVDGCGGDSQIAVLRDDGPSGLVNFQVVDALTKNLESADVNLGNLLLVATDIECEKWKEGVEHAVEMLEIYRKNQIEDFAQFQQSNYHLSDMIGIAHKEVDGFGLELDSPDKDSESQ